MFGRILEVGSCVIEGGDGMGAGLFVVDVC